MLFHVLKEIEASKGPIRLKELSQKLNIEPSVLDGMLEFWIRKGRILRSDDDYTSCSLKSCSPSCHSCVISVGTPVDD